VDLRTDYIVLEKELGGLYIDLADMCVTELPEMKSSRSGSDRLF